VIIPPIDEAEINICELPPGSWVLSAILPPNVAGRTKKSGCGDPQVWKKFAIRFSSLIVFYTGSATPVRDGKLDLTSTAVHEFGHATGWNELHLGGTNCDDIGEKQTMCAPLEQGEWWMRTLGNIDKSYFFLSYS
jgi:hypothetical protein